MLTLAQGRMLLLLGIARGEVLPRDPQQLAIASGPSLAAPVGVGLATRALVRRLPVRGPLVRAADRVCGHPRARHRPQSSRNEAVVAGILRGVSVRTGS